MKSEGLFMIFARVNAELGMLGRCRGEEENLQRKFA